MQMFATRRKMRFTLVLTVVAFLLLGLLYFLRPFWWESYQYENDQIKVRLFDAKGSSLDTSQAGTLVFRITGRGMERCGWGHSAFKNKTGEANGALLTIDSISVQLTDDAGLAEIPPYGGVGWGKRVIMGGCQYNLGFLLLISRPGYETIRAMPHFDQVNASSHVIRPPRPRRETTPAIQYARNRLWNELQLLYPTRIYSSASRPEEDKERQAMMSMAGYWHHRLPDGQTIRRYAVDNILRVNEGLACPRLQAEIRKIFSDPLSQPETEAEVLAEHNALRHALPSTSKEAVDSCELP
jgi:hypothetical protein